MTMRSAALAVVLVLLVPATPCGGAFADASRPDGAEIRDAQIRDAQVREAEAVPAPLRWVPGWLMESLRKAIADATDPRKRKQAARGG